jgi:hypothetical protein
MEIIDTASMEWEQLRVSSRNMRTSRKKLREGVALPGTGLYGVMVKLHDGAQRFTAPRHRHNFSQIRIGIRGHLDFGPGAECEPGDIGFFPGGAHYGPEDIDGGEYLLLQWGREWVSREQDEQAMRELSAKGRFEHGMYYFEQNGEQRAIDGKRAVWEYVYGRPEVIHPPRYRAPIVMTPSNFDWVRHGDTSRKSLGRFTEDEVTLDMVRWDVSGAVYELEPDRTSMVYVGKGTVDAAGANCSEGAVIWSDFGESLRLTGEPGTEATIIGLPLARTSI